MAFRPFLPPIESTMHVSSGRWLFGLLLALTTAVLWGILPIKLKEVLQVMDPITVTWYRLLVSGGLAALQAASIIAALPFSVIMLAMCYSLMQGLKQESQHQFEYRQKLKRHPGSVNLSLMDRIGPG